MVLQKVIDILAGSNKRFDIVDREINDSLEQHASLRKNELYNIDEDLVYIDSTWRDVKNEINNGPGTLNTGENLQDFDNGLGSLTENPVVGQGQIYKIDETNYSVFYIEPFDEASEVHRFGDTCYLGSPYILGETLEFSNLDDGNSNYTFAEFRQPKEPLRKPLQYKLPEAKKVEISEEC